MLAPESRPLRRSTARACSSKPSVSARRRRSTLQPHKREAYHCSRSATAAAGDGTLGSTCDPSRLRSGGNCRARTADFGPRSRGDCPGCRPVGGKRCAPRGVTNGNSAFAGKLLRRRRLRLSQVTRGPSRGRHAARACHFAGGCLSFSPRRRTASRLRGAQRLRCASCDLPRVWQTSVLGSEK